MSSRPRRSAAQKASVAITDMADRDNMSSSRSRRSGDGKGFASVSRGGQGEKDHTYLTVKLPANKLRQATAKQSSSIAVESTSKRPTRGNKKNYVVDDSDSDAEDDEGEDEIQVGAPAANEGDEDEDMNDADADADVDADADADADVIDDDMDVDAEGEDEEDAEGEEDVEMTPAQPPPVIKNSKTAKTSPSAKRTKQVTPKKAAQSFVNNADDSDDDELSDLSSDDEAINAGEEDAEGDEEDEELDADGDDIEEDQDAEGEAEGGPDVEARPGPGDIDSDDDSRGETPDLSRMTQRQRARFEGLDESHYQALSNEVQAKKHFTAEEKAMRRAEMARRRRNLSEKRNEEVKQETINKLLKKQAGKTNKKGLTAIGEEELDEDESRRPNPIFVRWTSNREGNRIAVPTEILSGPAGRVFTNATRPSGGPRKLIEEVSTEGAGNKENRVVAAS